MYLLLIVIGRGGIFFILSNMIGVLFKVSVLMMVMLKIC